MLEIRYKKKQAKILELENYFKVYISYTSHIHQSSKCNLLQLIKTPMVSTRFQSFLSASKCMRYFEKYVNKTVYIHILSHDITDPYLLGLDFNFY